MSAPDLRPSPWAPLSAPMFRALWLANLASDIGSAMHAVAAGWLMTQMAPSPLVVALVQAATMAPMFLLLLPAGALGDIFDRRLLLVLAQAWSTLCALALGMLTLLGAMSPTALLLLTLALGIGAALATPAFQSVVPELVPREHLPAAVSLSSMGINIARAAGPAIAGLVIASLGVAWVFVFNGVSFLGTIAVLLLWRRAPRRNALPPEHFLSALRSGWRYARHNPELRAVLWRSTAFFLAASSLWALLPLVGAQAYPGAASGYAILLSAIGVGAVIAALTVPWIRPRIGAEALAACATVLFALATAAAAFAGFRIVVGAMVLAGWGWLAMLTTLNITARFSIADWVMARGLAINQMVFFGSLTAGSVLWGQLASATSVATALALSAVALVLGMASALRWRLSAPPADALKPSRHWVDPEVRIANPRDRGPVLTVIEYEIEPDRREDFLAALQELKAARRRNGGYGWGVYEDLERPGRYIEQFFSESWLEHLRSHERATLAEKAAQDRVRRFHLGEAAPRVSHYVG